MVQNTDVELPILLLPPVLRLFPASRVAFAFKGLSCTSCFIPDSHVPFA